jgi:hypothetical protein
MDDNKEANQVATTYSAPPQIKVNKPILRQYPLSRVGHSQLSAIDGTMYDRLPTGQLVRVNKSGLSKKEKSKMRKAFRKLNDPSVSAQEKKRIMNDTVKHLGRHMTREDLLGIQNSK